MIHDCIAAADNHKLLTGAIAGQSHLYLRCAIGRMYFAPGDYTRGFRAPAQWFRTLIGIKDTLSLTVRVRGGTSRCIHRELNSNGVAFWRSGGNNQRFGEYSPDN